jgi:hypothetical protein
LSKEQPQSGFLYSVFEEEDVIDIDAVAGKCELEYLESVDNGYFISEFHFESLLAQLEKDLDVSQKDIEIFKKRVTITTGSAVASGGLPISTETRAEVSDEELIRGVPRLNSIPKTKSISPHRMFLQFDQNDITAKASDPVQFVQFMLDLQLLPLSNNCGHCNADSSNLHLQHSNHFDDGVCWKCSKCSYYYSVRGNSFFAQHHLTLVQQFRLIISFQTGAKGTSVSKDWNISENTVYVYWNLIRTAISRNIREYPISFKESDRFYAASNSSPPVELNLDDEPNIFEADESICLRVWTSEDSPYTHQWFQGRIFDWITFLIIQVFFSVVLDWS